MTRALLTGGTGKLGAGIASRLRAEGWQVLAAGSRDGDLARAADAKALVERAVAELGGLDVVVNGASAGFEPKRFEDVSEQEVDAALGATVKGSFFVTQAAAPHLRSTRGLVVMIEDVAAYQPWPSFAAHCAAKAAQAMLTRVLARRSRPRCASAASRLDRSPSSRARKSAAPPRRRSAASARPTTWPRRSSTSRARSSSRERRLSVDGGRLLQSGGSGHA